MGKSDPSNPNPHKQQTVILVPAETPGVRIERMLSVMGYDHAPHGHGHISFTNVRVPSSNIILGEGRGFEAVQGRLGPGRIHHAMRSLGAVGQLLSLFYERTGLILPQAEKALEYFVARLHNPSKKPFGKLLVEHAIMLERVARSRIEVDAARLAILNAAIRIDKYGAKAALKEIAEVKVQVPAVLLDVLDRAMQAHGAAGVSQDTPLASMWASARTMRIVDGPDEVHILQIGKNEARKGPALLAKLQSQKSKTSQLLAQYGLVEQDVLELNRIPASSKL